MEAISPSSQRIDTTPIPIPELDVAHRYLTRFEAFVAMGSSVDIFGEDIAKKIENAMSMSSKALEDAIFLRRVLLSPVGVIADIKGKTEGQDIQSKIDEWRDLISELDSSKIDEVNNNRRRPLVVYNTFGAIKIPRTKEWEETKVRIMPGVLNKDGISDSMLLQIRVKGVKLNGADSRYREVINPTNIWGQFLEVETNPDPEAQYVHVRVREISEIIKLRQNGGLSAPRL